jgi:hypothetical protein
MVAGTWVTEGLVVHCGDIGCSLEYDGKPVGGFEQRRVKIHSFNCLMNFIQWSCIQVKF